MSHSRKPWICWPAVAFTVDIARSSCAGMTSLFSTQTCNHSPNMTARLIGNLKLAFSVLVCVPLPFFLSGFRPGKRQQALFKKIILRSLLVSCNSSRINVWILPLLFIAYRAWVLIQLSFLQSRTKVNRKSHRPAAFADYHQGSHFLSASSFIFFLPHLLPLPHHCSCIFLLCVVTAFHFKSVSTSELSPALTSGIETPP